MAMPFDTLAIPPVAQEKGGVEILRAGVVEGGLHVSLRRSFDDAEAWGMVFADMARHVARIYAMEMGMAESTTLARIRAVLDAELDAPSDDGTTTAVS
jgi:Domain of unknown function (DUF5076)